jgi:hypothetical protein
LHAKVVAPKASLKLSRCLERLCQGRCRSDILGHGSDAHGLRAVDVLVSTEQKRGWFVGPQCDPGGELAEVRRLDDAVVFALVRTGADLWPRDGKDCLVCEPALRHLMAWCGPNAHEPTDYEWCTDPTVCVPSRDDESIVDQ